MSMFQQTQNQYYDDSICDFDDISLEELTFFQNKTEENVKSSLPSLEYTQLFNKENSVVLPLSSSNDGNSGCKV